MSVVNFLINRFSIEKLYAFFLISLIAWASFGFYTMSNLIHQQSIYGNLINMSGKQRMLSQQIILYSKTVFENGEKNSLPLLLESLNTMKKDHQYIINNLPSDTLRSVYNHAPYNIAQITDTFLSSADDLIANGNLTQLKAMESDTQLLPSLDFAVNSFQDEYEQKVKDAILTETIIFIGAFITLFFEAVFIVLPAVRMINQAKQDAEDALKAKQTFMQNINNELLSPLNAILGFVSLLLKREHDPSLLHYLKIVFSSAETLNKIVQDIYHHHKIREGTFPIDIQPFSPAQIVSETIELFSSRMVAKQIHYHAHLDEKLPDRLYGDPLRIKQIMGNLLDNATKFTPEGGTILIKTTYDAATQIFRFAIKDNGVGINSEDLEKIFEPFTQSDMSYTKKHHGIGMGLTISMELAQLMHGAIFIKSEVGQGSIVSLELPLNTIS